MSILSIKSCLFYSTLSLKSVTIGGVAKIKFNLYLKSYLSRSIMSEAPKLINFAKDSKKILGAAVNYIDMVKARQMSIPDSPVLFLKPSTSYIQEGQTIEIPKCLSRVVHEVELGVIIKKTGKNIKKSDAMSFVGGYCLALDLTAQCELGAARQKGFPWSMGKGFDTATPVSRFITPKEIENPNSLKLWCKVNGELKQNGNTSDLIFKIPDLIEYASMYMTLEPNDLILTGTPDGVSQIVAGDIIECGLDNIVKMNFKVKDA